jgi:hypothetical protein
VVAEALGFERLVISYTEVSSLSTGGVNCNLHLRNSDS